MERNRRLLFPLDGQDFRLRCPGNTMVEYTLIGGILLVMCIPAMNLFGGNLTGELQRFTGGIGAPATTGFAIEEVATVPISVATEGSNTVMASSVHESTLPLITQYTSADTTSGDGAQQVTETFSQEVTELAAALNNVDPKLAKELGQLAKSTANLADMEAAVIEHEKRTGKDYVLTKSYDKFVKDAQQVEKILTDKGNGVPPEYTDFAESLLISIGTVNNAAYENFGTQKGLKNVGIITGEIPTVGNTPIYTQNQSDYYASY